MGLSTSFFDISKDGSLAPNLVKVLADAHQEVKHNFNEYIEEHVGKSLNINLKVPEWLAEEAEKAKLNGDNYGGGYRHGRVNLLFVAFRTVRKLIRFKFKLFLKCLLKF